MSQPLSSELIEQLNAEAKNIGLSPSEFLQTLFNYYSFFQDGQNALFTPTLDRQFQNNVSEALKTQSHLLDEIKALDLK